MIQTNAASPLRIAILDCDSVPPVLVERYPKFSSMFTSRLRDAVEKSPRPIDFSAWDVIGGHYPDPTSIDGIIISGGKTSAYDPDPWITRLVAYIADVYQNHTNVKLFGACLGHQLIAHALLKEYGAVVQKNPQGLQLGIRHVEFDSKFRSAFPNMQADIQKVRFQVIHGDHVYCPPGGELPPGWMTIGKTQCCVVHGFWEPGRVLSFQGHFEFDRDITYDLVKVVLARNPAVTPEALQAALDATEGGDDADIAAGMIMSFFLGSQDTTACTLKPVSVQSVQEIKVCT